MRIIPDYARLHAHIEAWFQGELGNLVLVGAPGYGKSSAYKACLGNRPYLLFTGRLTPLQLYLRLCDDPHLPVVLDDISALLRQDDFRDMLKSLCETGERVVRWGTTTSKLGNRPQEIRCTGPVLIVMNEIPSRDADVQAVLDRCDAIHFQPTKAEVIARMHEIFPPEHELIDLLAELPTLPTLRTLVKAIKWKHSQHLNLVEELLAECGVPAPVSQLVQIMQDCPPEQWCDRYMAATGLTDRTYRRHKLIAQQLVECHTRPDPCPNVRTDGNGDLHPGDVS